MKENEYIEPEYIEFGFHGDSKRTIFRTLHAQLPMMRDYSESNFYAYF